jgi:hypothetical protein
MRKTRMSSPRKQLYNKKGYWKQRFKRFDVKVLQVLNREQLKGLTQPISNYFELGNESVGLGTQGEEILKRATELGMENVLLRDMVDMLNLLQTYSEGLHEVAKKKWAVGELKYFPVYRATVASWGTIQEEAEAIREMKEALK